MAASQTIMLVDDDPSTRALIGEWLDAEGYEVRTPSVSAIPFILVSADDNAARIALNLGIDEIIPKPFDADRLLRAVALYCDGRR